MEGRLPRLGRDARERAGVPDDLRPVRGIGDIKARSGGLGAGGWWWLAPREPGGPHHRDPQPDQASGLREPCGGGSVPKERAPPLPSSCILLPVTVRFGGSLPHRRVRRGNCAEVMSLRGRCGGGTALPLACGSRTIDAQICTYAAWRSALRAKRNQRDSHSQLAQERLRLLDALRPGGDAGMRLPVVDGIRDRRP